MRQKELPIIVEEAGELDVDDLIRALAHAITKGDPVGYLRNVAEGVRPA
jgi:hypothetical protein